MVPVRRMMKGNKEIDKAFSSMLQKVWDLHLKESQIHLILCGSMLSMMHSEALNYSAPLWTCHHGYPLETFVGEIH